MNFGGFEPISDTASITLGWLVNEMASEKCGARFGGRDFGVDCKKEIGHLGLCESEGAAWFYVPTKLLKDAERRLQQAFAE